MIITVSGTPGSGKTTVAQLLGEKLKVRYVYTGDIFRKLAEQHHMSLEEFGRYAETYREIDEELDQQQLEILKQGDVILEGRIAGWIAQRSAIPAVKVFLDADITTRAQRIVKREKGSMQKRKQEIIKREQSEATRYKQYYQIDLGDTSVYDLIIDTAAKTPEEIVDIIMEKIKQ